jgi:hypothetical protein
MRTAASLRRVQYSASDVASCQFTFLVLSVFAKEKVKLTPAIPTHSIHKLILTHLEKSLVARPASPVVRAMPSSTHTISNFPLLLPIANCDYRSNNFMAWDSGEDIIAEMALLEKAVGMADATRKYLDQNLA